MITLCLFSQFRIGYLRKTIDLDIIPRKALHKDVKVVLWDPDVKAMCSLVKCKQWNFIEH